MEKSAGEAVAGSGGLVGADARAEEAPALRPMGEGADTPVEDASDEARDLGNEEDLASQSKPSMPPTPDPERTAPRSLLGPHADELLFGDYRRRFLPAPHERLALPPAPSTWFYGVEIFLGSAFQRLDSRLSLSRATVVEIFLDGSFRLSSGETLGGRPQ